MGVMTGMQVIGDYVAGTDNITKLFNLIPDPELRGPGYPNGGDSRTRAAASMLDEMAPVAAAQLRRELIALGAVNSDNLTPGNFAVRRIDYTVTTADAAANLVNIPTGFADIALTACAVKVIRAGSDVTVDAVISEPSAGTIRVADGSTYNTTAGDIIRVWASPA